MKTLPFVLVVVALLRAGEAAQECTQSAKLDLQIIVDSSASVGEDHFHNMMEAIADKVVREFDIGPTKTRVALFKYSATNVMKNEIKLDSNKNNKKDRLVKAIKEVKYERGWTMTGKALDTAFEDFISKARKDKETTKVCLVFTDGEASDHDDVEPAVKKWTDEGVKVFSIGIGKGINDQGLAEIAGGDTNHVLHVDNFEAIADEAKNLLAQVCKELPPPKPVYKDATRWYCAVTNPGPVRLVTTNLREAQLAINSHGNKNHRQAIIPMNNRQPGDPHTLAKNWGSGSMWWWDWWDINQMRDMCKGRAPPKIRVS